MASVAPVNRVTNSRTQRLVWRVGARAAVRSILDDIDAQRARAQEVIDPPAASAEDRKSARATLRLAGAVKDLARFARGLA